jgi:hypothetical protein
MVRDLEQMLALESKRDQVAKEKEKEKEKEEEMTDMIPESALQSVVLNMSHFLAAGASGEGMYPAESW